MIPSNEEQVLYWFELALDQPSDERASWLNEQRLPAELNERVLRLLTAEARISTDGFLDDPARLPEPEPEHFPQLGERVGPFRLIERIDAGGMGVVYLAQRDEGSFQQRVALKLIRPLHLHTSAAFRARLIQRFENERQLLARLDHPNIARILDGGATADGVPWLAMEYIEGIPITDYCKSHGLNLRARLRLFLRVCAAVQNAHQHLIVHRDLKPGNILVTATGEPKLLDFGIAHRLTDDTSPPDTATDLTAMTPAYASPEQVQRLPLTTASDVYSLGVLLYQLLGDAHPYPLDGLSPADAAHRLSTHTPATLRTTLQHSPDAQHRLRAAQITPDLEQVVFKAMNKAPAQRYVTAQGLAEDIARWLDGLPVLAYPPSRRYRWSKFTHRHRLALAAGGVALIAVLSASTVALWQARQTRQAAADLRQMNGFLLEVLQGSDPYYADRELTLSEALDMAAENIGARFGSRPDLSAELRFGVGYSMLSRYRLEQAEQQLAQALQESRAAFGEDDIRTLRVREGIAFLRQEQGRYAEAADDWKRLIEHMERLRLTDDVLYSDAVGNLGNLYLVREDYPEADQWLQRCKDWFDAHPDAPASNRANLLSNLAHAAHGLEDLPRADELYTQAQLAMAALYPDGHPDLAILLNNHALLKEQQSDLPGALALHRQSLAMRRTIFRNEHPLTLTALTQVARLSALTGEAAQALPLAEEAAALSDRIYTAAPNGRHASTWATLAEVRLANGDVTGAVEALRRADALLATVQDPAPSVAVYLERVRASVCGQATQAEAC